VFAKEEKLDYSRTALIDSLTRMNKCPGGSESWKAIALESRGIVHTMIGWLDELKFFVQRQTELRHAAASSAQRGFTFATVAGNLLIATCWYFGVPSLYAVVGVVGYNGTLAYYRNKQNWPISIRRAQHKVGSLQTAYALLLRIRNVFDDGASSAFQGKPMADILKELEQLPKFATLREEACSIN